MKRLSMVLLGIGTFFGVFVGLILLAFQRGGYRIPQIVLGVYFFLTFGAFVSWLIVSVIDYRVRFCKKNKSTVVHT